MTAAEARERVARGAALLDEKQPGWEYEIDPGTLDLANGCLCVLGQVFGNFYASIGWMTGETRGQAHFPLASEYGFWAPTSNAVWTSEIGNQINAEYHALQNAWIEAIADRLVTAPALAVDGERVELPEAVVPSNPK
jgi:hypothetical protein